MKPWVTVTFLATPCLEDSARVILILCSSSVSSVTDFPQCGSLYVWVRGLGSVPDVPHAANVSFVTEGSGVGVSKEPPVNVKVVNTDSCYGYSSTLTSEAQVYRKDT